MSIDTEYLLEDDLCGTTLLLMMDNSVLHKGDFREFSISRWEIPIRRSDEILVVLPMKCVQFISHVCMKFGFSPRENRLSHGNAKYQKSGPERGQSSVPLVAYFS